MEKWEQSEVVLANWKQLCSHTEQFQGLSPISSPVTSLFIKETTVPCQGHIETA